MRRIVELVDTHILLRAGVCEKHRATRGAIVNVQYNIDAYTCAAYATTYAHGCIHRVQQDVCLPASW